MSVDFVRHVKANRDRKNVHKILLLNPYSILRLNIRSGRKTKTNCKHRQLTTICHEVISTKRINNDHSSKRVQNADPINE